MMNTVPRADSSLPKLLAARAHRVSDGRLVGDVLCGAAILAIALFLRPFAWVSIAAAGGCLAAFGLWGIFDRELGERAANPDPHLPTLLRLARGLSVLLGTLAALTLIFSVLGLALGTWIS